MTKAETCDYCGVVVESEDLTEVYTEDGLVRRCETCREDHDELVLEEREMVMA